MDINKNEDKQDLTKTYQNPKHSDSEKPYRPSSITERDGENGSERFEDSIHTRIFPKKRNHRYLLSLLILANLIYFFDLMGPIRISLGSFNFHGQGLCKKFRAFGKGSVDKTFAKDDINKFVWSRDLPQSDFGQDSNKRIIAIGDVHGMVDSLKKLLKKLKYDPKKDTVILIGDLAAKHPSIKSSLETIRYCKDSNFRSVRGNHDQYIIMWRNWMEIHRHKFIKSDPNSNLNGDEETFENDGWLNTDEPDQSLRSKLPPGLKWKTEHFEIAKRLTRSDFNWLLSLSLTIYSHPLKTYFVHAGLLPWTSIEERLKNDEDKLESILSIKENKDSFTLLEMRGVKRKRKPTKDSKKGKPWYKIWNKTMRTISEKDEKDVFNVVYGHWAAKGLKVKEFTFGLDSGCVYGKKLSSLVIEPKGNKTSIGEEEEEVIGHDENEDEKEIIDKKKKHKNKKNLKNLKINGFESKIVQVSCKEPEGTPFSS